MKQINYEAEHRKLWNWLADHPEAEKEDYFENWDAASVPKSRCFACEVACRKARRINTFGSCGSCPLGGPRVVGCDSGLYAVWRCAPDPEERQQLARKIAALPWKEKEND